MRSDDENKASFKDVTLRGAKITGNIYMSGASFDGTLIADSLQAESSLFMESNGQNKASFKDVRQSGDAAGHDEQVEANPRHDMENEAPGEDRLRRDAKEGAREHLDRQANGTSA